MLGMLVTSQFERSPAAKQHNNKSKNKKQKQKQKQEKQK